MSSSLTLCALMLGIVCVSIAFFSYRTKGLTGPLGTYGGFGLSGAIGAQGPSGLRGPTCIHEGIQGVTGPSGSDSLVIGPSGPSGSSGVSGPQGPNSTVQGLLGLIGPPPQLIPTVYTSTTLDAATSATFLNSVDDASTWTSVASTLPFNPVTKMISNGIYWVATGYNANASTAGLWWSYDQIVWTPCRYNDGSSIVNITFPFQKAGPSPQVCYGFDVCTNGTSWCAVGGYEYIRQDNSNLYYATDPRDIWIIVPPISLAEPDYNVNFDALTWTGSEYLASNGSAAYEDVSSGNYYGGGSLWYLSSDGTLLTNVATRMGTLVSNSGQTRASDIGSKLIYALNTVTYASNTNIFTFSSWTPGTAPVPSISNLTYPVQVTGFATNGSIITASTIAIYLTQPLGNPTVFFYSNTFNLWQLSLSLTYINYADCVYWNGSVFVGNGYNGLDWTPSSIATSKDGITWTVTMGYYNIVGLGNFYFAPRCIAGTNVTAQRPSSWTLLSIVALEKYGNYLR